MLKLMRRSANTWVIKILLILVALSFVVWGVGDYVNRSDQLPVAEGGDWMIYPQEFSVAYENEFNNMRRRFGGTLDKKTAEILGLKQRALTLLVNRHLILEAGRKWHLAVSPDSLRESIASNPAFSVGGQFDQERYRQLLRSNRLTPKEFENQRTADIISEQIQRTVGSVVGLPDVLLQDLYRLENEKRVVEMLKLKPKALESNVEATDEALTTFLKTHKERFMTQAQVKVQYVVLDSDSVTDSIKISPEEIKAFYEENLGDFKREERRRVSHILIKREPTKTAEEAEKEALARIQKAQERLRQGEAFAEVAKTLSDDVSKAKGGDLGEFARGVMVKTFEDVAFSLPEGKVSDPVETEFGYHLILVEAIHAGETKQKAQVSDEIKRRILELKAQELVYDRATVLEDQLFSSGDLKAIAADLNLRYKETGFLSRKKDGMDTIENKDKFLDAAFSTAVGEMSAMVEVKEGQFFALKVQEKKEPTPKALDEVRDAAVNLYKNEEAHKQGQELMDKALTLLQAGKTWEEAAAVHAAIHADVSDAFVRGAGKGAPSPAIRTATFKLNMEKPLYPEVLKGLGEFVLIRLQKIQSANPKDMPKAVEKIRSSLKETLSREQMLAFLDGLHQTAKVKVHSEVLEKF